MEATAYKEMADAEDSHWWFCGRRAMAEELLRKTKLSSQPRILEIGAGTGGNIPMLEKFGDVTGIEMEPEARSIALDKTGYAFLDGHLPDGLPPLETGFDLVCMFDVLEHVNEHEAALDTVHSLIGKDGYLLMSVPAHQWLWSRHDEYLHHFRRYSRKGLKGTLQQHGFEIERLTFTNMSLFPAAVGARVVDHVTDPDGKKPSTGAQAPSGPINNVMKALYTSEKHVLRHVNLPVGLGLMALARKV